jgi:hypothetical protein
MNDSLWHMTFAWIFLANVNRRCSQPSAEILLRFRGSTKFNSQKCFWKLLPSGVGGCLDRQMFTEVPEEIVASIFKEREELR